MNIRLSLFLFLTFLPILLCASSDDYEYQKTPGQIAFENEINSSMDKIIEKALTSGLTMDDVYLSIPEKTNHLERKAYFSAYAEKFKELVKKLWDQYGLIEINESDYKEVPHQKYYDEEYNKAHINYQKKWWEYLEAKANYRYSGGGSGAIVRYDTTIIKECIDRIIELNPSLK